MDERKKFEYSTVPEWDVLDQQKNSVRRDGK